MPKSRKRKTPICGVVKPATQSTSSASTRATIREFHVLLKKRTTILNGDQAGYDGGTLKDIEKRIEELGGLETYQRMSVIGQGKERGGGSERVLIEWLKEVGVDERCGSKLSGGKSVMRLRLLEVGALKPDNYASCSSWIDCTPIDLRSRHPSIQEQDFLLMNPDEQRTKWDVVSLSLVLNFAPKPKDRGQMLRLAHIMLKPDGYLFLVLPLPCVLNSRYLDFDRVQAIMHVIGFTRVKERWKEGGKIVYWLYQKQSQSSSPSMTPDLAPLQRKSVLRQGNRNNFSILL
ncbi:hypothetical protein AMATHDRAFT_63745 [Amanita thiersii Skay4041]|uniref:25S rRNA adenine-N(1) methyltransferase n=1 Tax=Amanita thiersii Skay4041 TaxID=703135 RepID=A0A2A9NLF8_9AGAR|nr:hypothetical protein AMATHDRAFT_63745 [Amanita thiersii Skay4041]